MGEYRTDKAVINMEMDILKVFSMSDGLLALCHHRLISCRVLSEVIKCFIVMGGYWARS